MEHVKEAFSKVKQDIDSLKKELSYLNEGLKDTRQRLIEICDVLKIIAKKNDDSLKKENNFSDNSLCQSASTNKLTDTANKLTGTSNDSTEIFNSSSNTYYNPAQKSETPTTTDNSTTDPTHNVPYNLLKGQNTDISTGNEGVPTNRQTNQQTNPQTDKSSYNIKNNLLADLQSNSIENAAKILDSLDNLKKEVRLKFKKLTEQEFSVFSIIYQLSEENQNTDYKNLSIKLGLTESSIRDYVGRLIKKGIPVEKTKINNKTVQLSISPHLKKIASLSTILQLRAI